MADAARPLRRVEPGKEDRAYHWVRRHIVVGQFAPGAGLNMTEIARTLGFSEIPVRAALQRLCGEGFVEFRQNAGFRVTILNPVEIGQASAVLGALWELAGRLAATRRTEEQLAELIRIHEQERTAVDASEYSDRSLGFHLLIAAMSGNSYLEQLTREVTRDAERGSVHMTLFPDNRRYALYEHDLIIEGLRRQQAEHVGLLIRWHMDAMTPGGARFPFESITGRSATDGDWNGDEQGRAGEVSADASQSADTARARRRRPSRVEGRI